MSMKEIALKLQSMDKQLTTMLPKSIDSNRFKRTVLMALERNPYLQKLDQQSLFKSCQLAAADGLLLDGREAALVPFGKEIQYIPMVGGLLKKLRQSGDLKSISAQIVHENDEFDFWTDEEGQHLKHRPNLMSRGKKVLAYAVAILKDGGVQIEVMTSEQILAIRKVSKAAGSAHSPWNTFEDEMWRKTVLRRICKYLPSSTELERLYEHDNESTQFIKTEEVDITPEPEEPSKLDELADKFESLETVDKYGEIKDGE